MVKIASYKVIDTRLGTAKEIGAYSMGGKEYAICTREGQPEMVGPNTVIFRHLETRRNEWLNRKKGNPFLTVTPIHWWTYKKR